MLVQYFVSRGNWEFSRNEMGKVPVHCTGVKEKTWSLHDSLVSLSHKSTESTIENFWTGGFGMSEKYVMKVWKPVS